jgi:iron complex outermembrane receptor protein
MATAGTTLEQREGGTMPGRLAPDGAPYPEELTTRRYDAGLVSRLPLRALVASFRGSASLQSHHHTFGANRERDRHLTWFGEATVTKVGEVNSLVGGIALSQERYRATDVTGVDLSFTTPGLFAQWNQLLGEHASVTASGRVDRHSAYGTQWTYRLSALRRIGQVWSIRVSTGTGYFAPTPFTEETEVVGLARLISFGGLVAERARNGTMDLTGSVAEVELVGTAFWSDVAHALVVGRAVPDSSRVVMANALDRQQTRGLELLARVPIGEAKITTSYTLVDAAEPLTPRHQAGLVIVWESEGRARVGFETYYVGEQRLDDDPYRSHSKPNIHVGLLIERRFGPLRVWLNGENLLGFRQTKYASLVRPTPGLGGRWTTDVWGPLEGRVANIGVKLSR